MSKQKTKPFVISILLIVVVILITSLLLIQFFPQYQQTGMFYGEEGIITYKSSTGTINYLKKYLFFLPQIMLNKDYIELGESITISDTSSYSCDDYEILSGGFRIWRDGEVTGDNIGLDIPECGNINIEVDYIPSKSGEYEIQVVYFSKNLHTGLPEQLDLSKLSFEVRDKINHCDVYWQDWKLKNVIDGGVVEQQLGIRYNNPPDCNQPSGENLRLRTVCNDGYTIKGESFQISEGGRTCEAVSGENIPEPIECNTNIELDCPNGMTIIIKECIDGLLKDTSQSCDEVVPTDITPIIEPSDVDIVSPSGVNYTMIIIGSTIGLLILIIIILIIKRFKK